MDVIADIWGYHLTWLEALSFVFNLVCVYLNTKENVWAWPLGIIGIVFFMILAYHSQLYSDVGLQVFFIASSLWGWYEWLHGGEKKDVLPVSRANGSWWLGALVSLVILYPLLGWMTDTYTDTNVPYFDAFPVTLSIIAQVMLARKIIENWHLWIFADVIYIGLFIYKSLYLMALLYAIFIALCFLGLIDWKKSMKAHEAQV